MREEKIFPRSWIVDNLRTTYKPSSWSGLADFGDTVQHAYRLDYWSRLSDYPCVFIEKDATAATIQPVTEEFDVALHVCRGYASVSFAGEIADQWSEIEKPIYAYYLGDFDASGFDIERDLRAKLERYSGRSFIDDDFTAFETLIDPNERVYWRRLGVIEGDFANYDLIPQQWSDCFCDRGCYCYDSADRARLSQSAGIQACPTLKGDSSVTRRRLAVASGYLREWHRRALPFIATRPSKRPGWILRTRGET